MSALITGSEALIDLDQQLGAHNYPAVFSSELQRVREKIVEHLFEFRGIDHQILRGGVDFERDGDLFSYRDGSSNISDFAD